MELIRKNYENFEKCTHYPHMILYKAVFIYVFLLLKWHIAISPQSAVILPVLHVQ